MSDNLINLADRPKEERKEIARKGGKASGEARRRRRTLREELDVLLSSDDYQEKVCTAIIDKAIKGDPRAFIAIRDSLGERPTDETRFEFVPGLLTGEEKAAAIREYIESLRSKD